MPIQSPYPNIYLPEGDILSVLCSDKSISDEPLWIDATTPSKALSKAGALKWIKRLGLGLRKRDITVGDAVVVMSPNHIFIPIGYFGIISSGAMFSGVSPAFTTREIAHQLLDTNAKLFLVHPSLLGRALEAIAIIGQSPDTVYLFSDEPTGTVEGIRDWRTLAALPSEAEDWHWDVLNGRQSETRVAALNYSSGTTGLPKGVMISHRNLVANVEQSVRIRPTRTSQSPPGERWIGFLPLYHAYGQLYTILLAWRLTIPVYILGKFDYPQFLATIQHYKITHLQAVPPVLAMLIKRPETRQYNLGSLKSIASGAAPLSALLEGQVSERFHVQVGQSWGMTELTCGAIRTCDKVPSKAGSVGCLLPNLQAKLVDEEGREVGPGEQGELLICGPNVSLGYWRNPKATKDTIDEGGWLKSGDIAIRDSEGRFWIVDRKKELMKVNGLQVSPAELESLISKHPRVEDVGVAAIRWQEQEYPRAYVVVREGAEQQQTEEVVRKWVDEQVAKHKRLRGGVRFVQELPKLGNGKLYRKVLREWAAADAKNFTPLPMAAQVPVAHL